MKSKPFISTTRTVEIYREMLWWRRELFADDEFFKVPQAWVALCRALGTLKTNTYRGPEGRKPKGAMASFGERATLSVDERILENAEKGGKLSNTLLAHEIAHLVLDHHAQSATTMHFQLATRPDGMAIRQPQNREELEADLGAIFLQCGVALADKRFSKLELANRACADVELVGKAQKYVQLDAFQRELERQNTRYERVVL